MFTQSFILIFYPPMKNNAVVKGLSSESESDEQETLSYFRQDARLTFYTLKDRKFVAYKK